MHTHVHVRTYVNDARAASVCIVRCTSVFCAAFLVSPVDLHSGAECLLQFERWKRRGSTEAAITRFNEDEKRKRKRNRWHAEHGNGETETTMARDTQNSSGATKSARERLRNRLDVLNGAPASLGLSTVRSGHCSKHWIHLKLSGVTVQMSRN